MAIELIKAKASSVALSRNPANVEPLKMAAEKISVFSNVYKGLNQFFDWLGYLHLSQRELGYFNRAQEQMKLTHSTFVFPALIKKSGSFVSAGKSLVSAISTPKDLKKKKVVGLATKTCNVGLKLISKCCKVFTCLDKTKLLNLAKISTNASENLSQVSAGAHFLASTISLGMAGQSLYAAYSNPSKTSADMPDLVRKENRKKICLFLKVAAAVASLASATFAILSIISGGFFSPLLLLSISTVAFALTLLRQFSKEDVSVQKATFFKKSFHHTFL